MRHDIPARVVVGVSESLAGLQALRCAASEARRRGAVLHAVRVWHFDTPWRPEVADWRGEMEGQALESVDAAFAMAMGGLPEDLTVQIAVIEGRPGPVLATYSQVPEDLLVIGAAGSARRPRLGPGSVTRYCLRHAGCPVLVVPAPAMARIGRQGALIRDLYRQTVRYVQTADH